MVRNGGGDQDIDYLSGLRPRIVDVEVMFASDAAIEVLQDCKQVLVVRLTLENLSSIVNESRRWRLLQI